MLDVGRVQVHPLHRGRVDVQPFQSRCVGRMQVQASHPREARNVPVEVRMIVERDMILLMQVVTCLCHLYAQGHHLNRSHCVMRVIQDIFTVDAQAVVAQQVEQGGRELSSALFATYWSSHGYRCSPAGICCQPFQASGFSSYSSYNCEFVGDFDGSCAPTTL